MGKSSWLWQAGFDRRGSDRARAVLPAPRADQGADDLAGFARRVSSVAADSFELYPDLADMLASDGGLDPFED